MNRIATVFAAFGRACLARDDTQQIWRCHVRGRELQPVCGDRVALSHAPALGPDAAVVTAIHTRRNVFARAAQHRRKVIAANLDQVAILVACEPSFSDELICRMLVVAELAELPAVLVLNKIDVDARLAQARTMLEPFVALGFPVIELAACLDASPLRSVLEGKRTLFTGQSGMGKSTLVQALVPEAEVRIREISSFLDSGKHATTGARMFSVNPHTEIVDTPGVTEFGLAGYNVRNIGYGFREFQAFAGQCRFADCRHLNEPGCAMAQAVQTGQIHPRRLALYQRIIEAERAATSKQSH